MAKLISAVAALMLALFAWEAGAQPTLVSETRTGKAKGQAIYFIPGLTAPGAAWDGVRPAFEADHSVRVLSIAGFGGTPPAPYQGDFYTAHAEAIAAKLKKDKVKGAVIVGHSLGGVLAMMVAERAPEQVARVVVVDSLPFLAAWFSLGQVQTPEQAKTFAERARAAMLAGEWSKIVESQANWLAIQSRDTAFHPQLKAWMLASDQKTVATAYGDLLALDYRPNLPNIKQPVLVLMSYDAAIVPATKEAHLAVIKAQYAGLPNTEIRHVEDARHWIQHDQKDVFISAVQAFIRQ